MAVTSIRIKRAELLWVRRLALVCALLLPTVAGAQGRSVWGIVTDRSGQPVQGAAVKLKNAITLQVRSYITQDNGEYRFHGLHPDMDYSVRARQDGHASKSREITRFNTRERIRIDLRLNMPDTTSE
jgi:protocatechuate 3,4-dioxygenase beta subunit